MAMNALSQERKAMSHPKKRVSVSKQRQITLPKEFYDKLGIDDEVFVELHDNRIVVRPVYDNEDFSEEILEGLVAEGFKGDELINEFKYRKSQVRPAFLELLENAKKEARSVPDDELFGDVEESDDKSV